jgi:hypothetical protein
MGQKTDQANDLPTIKALHDEKITLAIASILLTGMSSAATISFSPATLSVARGTPSSDISC